MNYKKLKRVFALGMAVLLSVSTSVYGGTMEVHAAEVISDNLLENEVTDNLSLDENKGDDQDDAKDAEQGDSQDNAQDAGQDDGQDNAQNAGQGDSNDNVQNAEQGDTQNAEQDDGQDNAQDAGEGDAQGAGQDDSQDNAQNAGQGDSQNNAQNAGQDATVLTEQDAEPAALAATKAAPTKVKQCEFGSSLKEDLNLEFEDSAWVNSITALKVGGDSFKKVDSLGYFESENKFGCRNLFLQWWLKRTSSSVDNYD